MTIEWVNPGLATTLQGKPYRRHRHTGMPLSGAADAVSLALANWLAGNPPETAAIETAYAAIAFRAHCNMAVGVAGAADKAFINGEPQDISAKLILAEGDQLEIPPARHGCRSYIAVHRGFAASHLLGGNSTYLPAAIGGSTGLKLEKNVVWDLASDTPDAAQPRKLPPEYRLNHGDTFLLRMVDAPESKLMENPDVLFDRPFTVSRRGNRTGLELTGANITLQPNPHMQSSAVFPGTIQCPPSGNPFSLGADAQTTGGYPRVAQIIRADRHLIGQLRPGARLRLQRVKPAEARRLYRSKLDMLRKLMPEIRLD